ncbi:hypothetical protein RN001_002205 [Aquatica leii]|uniref:Uncharacterized protein n=1 Tax=Aquatica leii TaxID=1421715 RepID=A0AAN7Q4Z3_9COLE|nr:hypothetical protein RN001_002205 [Aquatica leii]
MEEFLNKNNLEHLHKIFNDENIDEISLLPLLSEEHIKLLIPSIGDQNGTVGRSWQDDDLKTVKTTKVDGKRYIVLHAESNRILLTGKTKPSDSNKINFLWAKFTQKINSNALGPSKTADQWRKVNVRRKSRSLEIERLETGGGPNSYKSLTDLEERLLSVITKIHLGDAELPETFDVEIPEITMDDNNMVDEDVVYVYESDTMGIPQSQIEFVDEDVPMPSTSTNFTDTFGINKKKSLTPTKKLKEKVSTPTPKKRPAMTNDHTYTPFVTNSSRYTSAMLQSACEIFKDTTIQGNQAKMAKVECLNQVAASIAEVAAAIKIQTGAIEQKIKLKEEKLKLEKQKLKLEYYKIFGNLDNFKDF